MIDPHVVEARVSPEGRLRVLSKSEIAKLLDSGAVIHLPSDITALGPGGKIGDPPSGGTTIKQF